MKSTTPAPTAREDATLVGEVALLAGSEDAKKPGPDVSVEPHPDERQVRLDTDRSFVIYPVGEPLSST